MPSQNATNHTMRFALTRLSISTRRKLISVLLAVTIFALLAGQFGVVPSFRVGVHGGEVAVSEQGDTKRAIGILREHH
jgi:hypothetical protein